MALKCLSMCLWFLAFLNVGVYLCGSIAVPMVLALFSCSVVISVVNKSQEQLFRKRKNGYSSLRIASDKDSLLEKGISLNTITDMLNSDYLALDSDETQVQNSTDETDNTQPLDSKVSPPIMSEDDTSVGEVCWVTGDKRPALAEVETETDDERMMVSFSPYVEQQHHHNESPTLCMADLTEKGLTNSKTQLKKSSSQDRRTKDVGFKNLKPADEVDGGHEHHLVPPLTVSNRARAQSNQVFLLLLAASLMVTMWKHPILLLIPVPLVLWSVVKHIPSLAIVKNSAPTHVSSSLTVLKTWVASQRHILFPWPMPTMVQACVTIDNKVLSSLKRMVGSLVSAFIIFVLLVGALAVMVFVLFQVQLEVMHYLNAAVTAWNVTMANNPQIKE